MNLSYSIRSDENRKKSNLLQSIFQQLKDNLNKLINELKVRVSEIEVIKNDIVKKLNELKENIQNEIELAVILLETYEFEIEQKNLNYFNYDNLIDIGKNFKQFYQDFQIKINKSKEIIEIFNYFNTYDGEENKITDNENKISDNENNNNKLLVEFNNNLDLLKKNKKMQYIKKRK